MKTSYASKSLFRPFRIYNLLFPKDYWYTMKYENALQNSYHFYIIVSVRMISSYVREKGIHLGRNSMIDKSKEYWYGDSADDIDEYLILISFYPLYKVKRM